MALSKGYPSHYASFHNSFLDLSQAVNRLKTFLRPVRWPEETGIAPEELADEGFIFFKTPDIVQCVYCALKLHKWTRGIDPLEEHFQKSQRKCEFAIKRMVLRRKQQQESISGELLSIVYDRRSSGYQSGCTSQYNSFSSIPSHHSQRGGNLSACQIPSVVLDQTAVNGSSRRQAIPMNRRETCETIPCGCGTVTSTCTGKVSRNLDRNKDLCSTKTQVRLRGTTALPPPNYSTDRRTSVRSHTSDRAIGEASAYLDPSVRTDASPNDGKQLHQASSDKALERLPNEDKFVHTSENLNKSTFKQVPRARGACYSPNVSLEAVESAVFSDNDLEVNTILPEPTFKPEQCENNDVTKSLISLVFDSGVNDTSVKSNVDSIFRIPLGYFLNSAMDTDKVQLVLNEGYSRDVVLAVVTQRLKTAGDNFRTAHDLLKAVFDYEDSKAS